jgi:hypothetical protein
MIADASRGVPRTINILCDTALVYAFAANRNMVTPEIVNLVLQDKKDYGIFGALAEKTS